jgi:(E)-4-hydroxy-3-methylbut-2-enyl-diphosphate synthase
VHFNHRLALAAIAAGAHGLRINPGNIGSVDEVKAVARAAANRGIPVRVGVNSGSLEPSVRAKYGAVTPEALVESALRFCEMLESAGCHDLKVSLKSPDVPTTVAANRQFAARTDYPLHLGVTEAGTEFSGTVKSAIGIGSLLLDGIGNTLRVSLTTPPREEVKVALRILEVVGLRCAEPEIISCPTCGRTRIDLVSLVRAVEEEILRIKSAGHRIHLRRIAIMGCAVNGPGEARDADLGIAAGVKRGVMFRHGQIVQAFPEHELLPGLLREIEKHTSAGER